MLTACGRLFENSSKELFDKFFPGYKDKMYKTKSGKEIEVSGGIILKINYLL